MAVNPVGYLVIRDNSVKYHPIGRRFGSLAAILQRSAKKAL